MYLHVFIRSFLYILVCLCTFLRVLFSFFFRCMRYVVVDTKQWTCFFSSFCILLDRLFCSVFFFIFKVFFMLALFAIVEIYVYFCRYFFFELLLLLMVWYVFFRLQYSHIFKAPQINNALESKRMLTEQNEIEMEKTIKILFDTRIELKRACENGKKVCFEARGRKKSD